MGSPHSSPAIHAFMTALRRRWDRPAGIPAIFGAPPVQAAFRSGDSMRIAVAAAMLLAASAAVAHGPTRQKVTESIEVPVAPEAAWARIKDFNALQSWHPAVESSTTTDGNNVGSVRTLSLKGGGQIVEELEAYSDADRKMSYRMKDPGPVPVSNYTSTITVKPAESGGGSLIEWRGAFYRGFPNNDPPPDRNDEAAVKAVTDIYQAGLGHLKELLQAK
jgi:carbon monoxide dehydrogenase subunit G